MRVLHVLNELRPSGAETMLTLAGPHWASHGVTCEIVSTGQSEGEYADILRRAGYRVHHLPVVDNPLTVGAFSRLMSAADVVHLHAERAAFWYFAIARLAGVGGIVRTVHSVFPFGGLLKMRRMLQRRLMAAGGVAFVAIGPSVAENEYKRFGVASQIVENWIDVSRFKDIDAGHRRSAREVLGLPASGFVFVTVGNCSAIKNHVAVIEGLQLYLGSNPGAPVCWLHVGREDVDRSESRKVTEAGLADKVRFVGSRADVDTCLAAADAFLMPSVREGFGIAAAEALASGLPCALAAVPGLRDFAALDDEIVWFTPNREGVAEAIGALRGSNQHGSQRNRESLRARFDVRRGVAEYVRVYRAAGLRRWREVPRRTNSDLHQ